MSTIIAVLLIVLVFAVILYLLNTYVAMPQPIKMIVNLILILILLIWVLNKLGFI